MQPQLDLHVLPPLGGGGGVSSLALSAVDNHFQTSSKSSFISFNHWNCTEGRRPSSSIQHEVPTIPRQLLSGLSPLLFTYCQAHVQKWYKSHCVLNRVGEKHDRTTY